MDIILSLERNFAQVLTRLPLRQGERVLVAVSGGSDSVALLQLFCRVAPLLGVELRVAHLDHAIRAESAADAAFVRALCARLELPLVVERCDVPALARSLGVGLEEAGREARREFLQRCATRYGCTLVALGHQRGDQAETVLHHLLRGCGVTGLAAMRLRSGLFIRPLLDVPREQLRDYLAARGEGFVEDASNSDLALTRNRIRHEVLPALAALNPRIETALVSLAEHAARDEDYWQGCVAQLRSELVVPDPLGLCMERPRLLALPPAVRFRLLRSVLQEVAGNEVGAVHLEAGEALLQGAVPQQELHFPGCRLLRRYERVLVTSAPAKVAGVAPWQLEVAGPGDYLLPTGGRLRVELDLQTSGATPLQIELAAAAIVWPLLVRNVRPGDRMCLAGMRGRKRVKELLAEQRIPLEERRRLVVVTTVAGEILWLAGVRRAAAAVPPTGTAVLRLTLETPTE